MWRHHFIRTYLERDIPQLGPRVPAETLRRFWTMLAHLQGGTLNVAQIARGLGVDGKTAARYLDLLVDLLLVRRLPPLHANVGKRLVKSPKIYVRDSGIVHALLGFNDREDLDPERSFVVYSGDDRYPKGDGIEVIGLDELASLLAGV